MARLQVPDGPGGEAAMIDDSVAASVSYPGCTARQRLCVYSVPSTFDHPPERNPWTSPPSTSC